MQACLTHSTVDPEDFWLRTPKSEHTSSEEVFELAHNWISQCHCAEHWDKPGERWYPKRLLDLEQLRTATGLKRGENLTFFSENANLEHAKVRLVESTQTDFKFKPNERFVTLSHCWGRPKSVQGQLKLTSKTEEKFKRDGIELRAFSKTFRDAILFACRLEKVGYIWIDSLCIRQPQSSAEDSDEYEDWLEQSRVMDKIYQESFLNISATAAVDGDQGLFFPRKPEYLWEDEINLNLVGLSGHHRYDTPDTSPKISAFRMRDADHKNNSNLTSERRRVGMDYLRRCTIIDVSFWDDLVDHAPVNQRAWVLQERLMSPRVLHFCRNQIAWECSEFDSAEGHPEGVPTFKIKQGDIVDEGRFKSLDPHTDGRRLREIRLMGLRDPDEGMENLYVYELWKRIVEVYSKTKLTMSRDKLIALSGIARKFSKLTGAKYIAGMWEQYLESQLLWRVEPIHKDGLFENHSTRDPLRAPSFSWAALDVPQGIVYGEATDYGDDRNTELLFSVEKWNIDYSDLENKFGMIEEGKGYLQLKVKNLRKIKLRKLDLPRRVPYGWRIDDGVSAQSPEREHSNVYLDAPESDVDIFSADAEIYCMPAAWGERTVKENSRYLMCLLLKQDGRRANCRRFKRIGLTKLSNHADSEGQKALLGMEREEKIFLV
ncbi:heterokaryon incompatibility protein [Neofusicoccum parvum]|uniref:Heterokaryon incompatibility protein n=1 Tax=Neofusicoccum parvum TaxID=310453 RepID=A0ACB5SFC4_9PEZI|nr:heterokaryon incompatibility protein [Neofusicoccum parvum]